MTGGNYVCRITDTTPWVVWLEANVPSLNKNAKLRLSYLRYAHWVVCLEDNVFQFKQKGRTMFAVSPIRLWVTCLGNNAIQFKQKGQCKFGAPAIYGCADRISNRHVTPVQIHSIRWRIFRILVSRYFTPEWFQYLFYAEGPLYRVTFVTIWVRCKKGGIVLTLLGFHVNSDDASHWYADLFRASFPPESKCPRNFVMSDTVINGSLRIKSKTTL